MPPTATREDLRDAILDATDRLLARYGYRKMTMDDLAQEVGIGKGTIYLHFPSKEELVLSHVDRIVERLRGRLLAVARGEGPAHVRVRRMLLERVLFRFDSVQHYTESISEVLRDLRSELLKRRQRYFEQEAELFAVVLKEGQRLGVFRRQDATEAAHALITATNSLLPYSLSSDELGKRDEVEAATKRVANLLLNGL